MPRSSDPKLDVRFSSPGLAAIRAAADSIGVKPGTLVRECAERYATTLAREVSEGRVSLARRASPRTEYEAAPSTPAPSQGPARAVPAAGPERADLFRRAEALRAVR